jgi:hypothetical protein
MLVIRDGREFACKTWKMQELDITRARSFGIGTSLGGSSSSWPMITGKGEGRERSRRNAKTQGRKEEESKVAWSSEGSKVKNKIKPLVRKAMQAKPIAARTTLSVLASLG